MSSGLFQALGPRAFPSSAHFCSESECLQGSLSPEGLRLQGDVTLATLGDTERRVRA